MGNANASLKMSTNCAAQVIEIFHNLQICMGFPEMARAWR